MLFEILFHFKKKIICLWDMYAKLFTINQIYNLTHHSTLYASHTNSSSLPQIFLPLLIKPFNSIPCNNQQFSRNASVISFSILLIILLLRFNLMVQFSPTKYTTTKNHATENTKILRTNLH